MGRQTCLSLVVLFTVAFSGTVGLAYLSSGLVAYYPFNGNAKDMTINGLDGTVYGATFVDGISEKALSLG